MKIWIIAGEASGDLYGARISREMKALQPDIEIGGTNDGLRPKALMLNALAGCTGIDVASLLPKMKVLVDSFHIDVEGDLTEEHPKYYHSVRVVYHFYGDDLEKEKLQKIVNLSVEKYCGVMEMFRKFAQVDVKIEYHPKV